MSDLLQRAKYSWRANGEEGKQYVAWTMLFLLVGIVFALNVVMVEGFALGWDHPTANAPMLGDVAESRGLPDGSSCHGTKFGGVLCSTDPDQPDDLLCSQPGWILTVPAGSSVWQTYSEEISCAKPYLTRQEHETAVGNEIKLLRDTTRKSGDTFNWDHVPAGQGFMP